MASDRPDIARILEELRQGGDPAAVDALFALVYDELHTLAQRQRRQWNGAESLNTTALVHEAYLKLVGQERVGADSRAHFFALAARAMRHILSNHARAHGAQKRGRGQAPMPLHEIDELLPGPLTLGDEHLDILVALDEALGRLAERSERQSQVVECRFYGGMSVPETAAALGVSPATVKRDWALAQVWLYRELRRG